MNVTPKRIKIVFLITKSTLGGAQQYVSDLMSNLPQDRFESVIVVGGNGPLIDILKNEGFHVYTLPTLKRDISFFNEIRTFFTLISILRTEKPDILHINSSKAGVIGSVAGRLTRVPRIIFTVHGWAFNEDRSALQKRVFKTLHFITILLTHVTIVVSNGTKAQMNWPFVQKKMRVVHLGRTVINIKQKEEARGILEMRVQDSASRLMDYHEDFWIGTIAELHPIKRLNRAIDAVATLVTEIPKLRFIIVHDGQLRAQLEQQVRDLHLEHHVFFTGTIENAARLLPAFDLFVLPSKSEAFAYVLIEAGQAHVPVVATHVGGIPDVITNNKTGLLVPPDDTEALTDALRTMITNDELRHTLADAHYENSKLFTVEKMIDETIAVYQS